VIDSDRLNQRIVITGIGPVTPIGIGVDAFWDSLRNGRSGVERIQAYDATDHKVQIAAEVNDFDTSDYIDPKAAKRMARFAEMGVVAAHLAVQDAGLDLDNVDLERVASVVNTGGGGVTTISSETQAMARRGADRVSPFFVPIMASNMASCQVSIELGLQGPAITSAAACASSIYAFQDSAMLMRLDEADVVISGGTESNISALGIAGLANMHALSRNNDDPTGASRPFDKERDGFVFGEGAVVCVLESLEAAQHRGARIYAEVLGAGRTADAFHITQPRPDGAGAARAMNLALRNAGLDATDVDYICAHGTSTSLNDLAETIAIKTVFGEHANQLAISSPKSMTGHLMGAAGSLSVAATALAIHHGELPPTINLNTPDPDCDLDYVPNQSRRSETKVALANGFGFGGQNAVVALGAIDR
jgi:3-oxoacyl-[acyl-carrier-protein] synthase II